MIPALAIHGGAGTILKSLMTDELEREYHSGLEAALNIGWKILKRGGSALDAVEAAVVSLEDFPLFNAGRGSVFTHDGKQEMDACLTDGSSMSAGAVTFVSNIKNPIKLARAVMTQTDHVLLAGDGAMEFAESLDFSVEPDEYFFTEHRWLQLQDAISQDRVQLDHSDSKSRNQKKKKPALAKAAASNRKSMGTVGAVACDRDGRLAAATSTGGMTNKKFGRIGDTPIVGLGTFADKNCAVSCTGHGEFFMRGVTAYDVAARMKYKRIGISKAAAETVRSLKSVGGEGGLIAVDRKGTIVLPFNSEGMYRAWISGDRPAKVAIYREG